MECETAERDSVILRVACDRLRWLWLGSYGGFNGAELQAKDETASGAFANVLADSKLEGLLVRDLLLATFADRVDLWLIGLLESSRVELIKVDFAHCCGLPVCPHWSVQLAA